DVGREDERLAIPPTCVSNADAVAGRGVLYWRGHHRPSRCESQKTRKAARRRFLRFLHSLARRTTLTRCTPIPTPCNPKKPPPCAELRQFVPTSIPHSISSRINLLAIRWRARSMFRPPWSESASMPYLLGLFAFQWSVSRKHPQATASPIDAFHTCDLKRNHSDGLDGHPRYDRIQPDAT